MWVTDRLISLSLLGLLGCGALETPVIIARQDAERPDASTSAPESPDAGGGLDASLLDATAPRPDLAVVRVSAAPDWVAPGTGLQLEATVAAGPVGAPATQLRVIITPTVEPFTSVQVGTAVVFELAGSESREVVADLWIPADIRPARYRVEVLIDPDDQISESDETNNTGSAGPTWVSPVQISPAAVDFGVVGIGCTAQHTVTVRNRGQSPSFVSPPSIVPPASPFLVIDVGLPRALQAGAQLDLPLEFTPTAAGTFSARLQIRHDQIVGPVDVPLIGAAADTPLRIERFTAWPQPRVDILVVADDSPSMADEVVRLTAASGALIQRLQDQGVDFHLGVTTTDVTAAGPRGRLVGLVPIIDAQTPQPAHHFAQNLRVGSSGAEDERGLDATTLALSASVNPGFRRPEAALAVMWLSDGDDRSLTSVEAAIAAIGAEAGRRALSGVFAAAVISPVEAPCPGASSAGQRYAAAARMLGGEVIPLCQFAWDASLPAFPTDGFGVQVDFPLGRAPVGDDIEVFVDGAATPARPSPSEPATWWLDEDVLRFDPAAAPAPGAKVRVQYRTEC